MTYIQTLRKRQGRRSRAEELEQELAKRKLRMGRCRAPRRKTEREVRRVMLNTARLRAAWAIAAQHPEEFHARVESELAILRQAMPPTPPEKSAFG